MTLLSVYFRWSVPFSADFSDLRVFFFPTFIFPFNLCFSFVVLLYFYMCPIICFWCLVSVLQSPTPYPKNTCTQKKKQKIKPLPDFVCLGYAQKWQHKVECYSRGEPIYVGF